MYVGDSDIEVYGIGSNIYFDISLFVWVEARREGTRRTRDSERENALIEDALLAITGYSIRDRQGGAASQLPAIAWRPLRNPRQS